MILAFPRQNIKAEDHKWSKRRNINVTHNTSNMNTDITQADVAAFHTYHTKNNSIPTQAQIPCMRRQIGGNPVSANNDVSVNGSGSSKRFSIQYDKNGRILSILISKSIPETNVSLQIILPSMMVKSDMIVILILIVTPIQMFLVRTF